MISFAAHLLWLALAQVPTQVPTPAPTPAPTPVEDRFAKPFRFAAPTKELPLTDELGKLLSDAHTLRQSWVTAKDRGHDEQGRPTSKKPEFVTMRDDLRARLQGKGGYLGWIIREDRSSYRRHACYFAGLFLPEIQDALHIFRYLPYEPMSSVRQAATREGIPFLAAQLRVRTEDARDFQFTFEHEPWADLTRAPEVVDRVLGLEALAAIATARPTVGAETARLMQKWIPDLLRSKHAELVAAARRYLQAVHPEAVFPGTPEEDVAYFARILRVLYPDIRLQGGYCEIFPGPDRDRLVAVGTDMLRRSRLGVMCDVALETRLGKRHVSGLRLGKLPEPLDRLGLEEGDVLTHLNGTPIAGHGELLKMLLDFVDEKATSFVIEWVRNDKEEHARRYVLR